MNAASKIIRSSRSRNHTISMSAMSALTATSAEYHAGHSLCIALLLAGQRFIEPNRPVTYGKLDGAHEMNTPRLMWVRRGVRLRWNPGGLPTHAKEAGRRRASP